MTESKGEHSFVADAHNWEQRIKTENEASQIWTRNWGSLYASDAPTTYRDKIAALESSLAACPAQTMATNTMLSYMGDKAFDEPTWQNFGKKTFGKFESFGDFGEKLDPKYKPAKN